MPKAKAPRTAARKRKPAPRRAPAVEAPERGELGDRRRLELLGAAYAIIAEKGLAGLRTRDVAARAKVNISTLHYYFGTKEALLAALVEYACRKFEAGSSAPAAAARADDPLHEHFAESWRVFSENRELPIVLEELSTRSRYDASTRAAFRATYQRWNGAVVELLRALAAAGLLRPGLDPEKGAFIVSSFIIGASTQLGVDRKAFDFSSVARELERWAGSPLAARDE